MLVAPRSRRHVLCSALLGVCWGVNVVFTIKIEREMAIFQARMKKSNWCLCQFRLFFFQLTFTGGNRWPNLVPTIPFGRKSGVFFCLQIEKVLCFFFYRWRSCWPKFLHLYLHQIEISISSGKAVHVRSRLTHVACYCKKTGILLLFFIVFHVAIMYRCRLPEVLVCKFLPYKNLFFFLQSRSIYFLN